MIKNYLFIKKKKFLDFSQRLKNRKSIDQHQWERN